MLLLCESDSVKKHYKKKHRDISKEEIKKEKEKEKSGLSFKQRIIYIVSKI